jgi:hypothetical protein
MSHTHSIVVTQNIYKSTCGQEPKVTIYGGHDIFEIKLQKWLMV